MPILGKEFGSWMQAEHARTPASARRMPGTEGLVGGGFTFHLLSTWGTPGAEGLVGGDFTFHLLSTRGTPGAEGLVGGGFTLHLLSMRGTPGAEGFYCSTACPQPTDILRLTLKMRFS